MHGENLKLAHSFFNFVVRNVNLDFKHSPCSECCVLSFG